MSHPLYLMHVISVMKESLFRNDSMLSWWFPTWYFLLQWLVLVLKD